MGVKTNLAIQNFSSGQLSPKMRGRFELPQYASGYDRSENFKPYLQGPAVFRQGGTMVRETSPIGILIPFVYDDEQAYMLEFTHRRMRVFQDGELVIDPTGIGPVTDMIDHPTEINTTRMTLNSHGLTDYDEVYLEDFENPGFDGGPWTVRVETANTFRIDKKFTGTFIASPDSRVKRVAGCATPWRAYDDGVPNDETPVDAENVEYLQKGTIDADWVPFEDPEFLTFQTAQARDVMYVVHKLCEPRKITRVSVAEWTCATYVRTADPFKTAAVIDPDKFPAAVTFFEQRLFYGGFAESPEKIVASRTGSFEDHTTGVSSTHALEFTLANRRLNTIRTLTANEEFIVAGCSDGAIKLAGENGAALSPSSPPKVGPVDSYGASKLTPVLVGTDIIYVQKNLTNMRAITLDTQAGKYVPIDLTKNSDEVLKDEVVQIAYQEGTPSVVWAVLRSGKLVGLNYDPEEGIIAWHPHATRAGDKIKSLACAPVGRGIDQAWYMVERQINGETKYFIEYEVLAPVYPKREDFYTGATAEDKVTDEAAFRLAMYFAMKEAFHLDCGLTYDSPIAISGITKANPAVVTTEEDHGLLTGDVVQVSDVEGMTELNGEAFEIVVGALNTFQLVDCDSTEFNDYISGGNVRKGVEAVTGLDHLEGEEVAVIVDGSYHSPQTVESGEIALDRTAYVVHVGLPYSGYIKTNNLESGGMNGPAQGKIKNVHRVNIRFLDTLGASYGTDPYNLEAIEFRSASDPLGRSPPLFSGEKEATVFDTSATEKFVYIRQDYPLPCTVQIINPSLTTEND